MAPAFLTTRLFVQICASAGPLISFLPKTQRTPISAGGRKKKRYAIPSLYAKSLKCSICKPGLAAQTEPGHLSRLHILPWPFFSNVSRWADYVAGPRRFTQIAHTWQPRSTRSQRNVFHTSASVAWECVGICGRVCFSVATNWSTGGKRSTPDVGGPLICSATATVG